MSLKLSFFARKGYECLKTEFRCYDNSSCVDERLLCDGRRDCQDNSDEENCMWRDKRFSDTNKESLAHDGKSGVAHTVLGRCLYSVRVLLYSLLSGPLYSVMG